MQESVTHALHLSQSLTPRLAQPFDPKRSLAWAGVIALHGVVIAALLLPREPNLLREGERDEAVIVDVEYEVLLPPPLPEVPPPPPLPIQRKSGACPDSLPTDLQNEKRSPQAPFFFATAAEAARHQ